MLSAAMALSQRGWRETALLVTSRWTRVAESLADGKVERESVRTEPWSAAMAELKTAARSLGGKVSIELENCISMVLANEQLEC
jgi:hypothetical protein